MSAALKIEENQVDESMRCEVCNRIKRTTIQLDAAIGDKMQVCNLCLTEVVAHISEGEDDEHSNEDHCGDSDCESCNYEYGTLDD